MPKLDDDEEVTIIEKAMKYCWSNDFLNVFRNFFKEHAEPFSGILTFIFPLLTFIFFRFR